ncbi:MAG: hypothetical protein WC871_02325 [Bacteroidales bacterium]
MSDTISRTGLVFDPQNLAYKATPKENPKDKIEVVVGDDRDPAKFQPQVKIQRWENEVNASIRLILPEDANEIITHDERGAVIDRDKLAVNMYERDDMDEGGFEFEIVLREKPAANTFQFSVNTKELDWFYQPALSQEEIDEGFERPENVVGSYAVYHKYKGGMNDINGMEYKVGKAFHLYRPFATDSKGDRIWGELSLAEQAGILTLTLDEKWLENAVYPVIIDPTFGYTSVGASSSSNIGQNRINGSYATISVNGDVTSLTTYSRGATVSMGGGIYTDTGSNYPNSKVAEDTGNTTVTTTAGWRTVNISASLTGGTKYWLLNFHSSTVQYYPYLDSAGTGQFFYKTETFETWPSTMGVGGSQINYVNSIYATYTAGSLTANSTRAAHTTGIATTSSTRAAHATGSLTANSTRPATLEGEVGSVYTKEVKETLPTDDSNLAGVYSSQEVTDVSTDDGTRVPLVATSTDFMVHMYKEYNDTANADPLTVTWNGQSTLAPTAATVYLQVYNHNSDEWENLDTETSAAKNTDFTLTGSISTNPENYYDANYLVACRVYQEVT